MLSMARTVSSGLLSGAGVVSFMPGEKRVILPRSRRMASFGENGEPMDGEARLSKEMGAPLVEFSGLAVSYGPVPALAGQATSVA